MRDQLLRPTAFDNIFYSNYAIKADWSTLPVYMGRNSECRSILAILTSTRQLLIFGRRNRRYSTLGWSDPWEQIVDISSAYNKHLLKLWDAEEQESKHDVDNYDSYDLYKNRLYELAITDFLWLPDWKLDPEMTTPDETKGVFKSYLMTFHASGSVIIWKIVISKTAQPKYTPIVVHKDGIFQNPDEDVISAAAYSYISPKLGHLVVGTNKGKIISYNLERCKKVKVERNTSKRYQKYRLHCKTELWEEDMLRVESIMFRQNVRTGTKYSELNLFAVKHPNIILTTSITTSSDSTQFTEFEKLKTTYGTIVGLNRNREGRLILSHEPGILSLVDYDISSRKLTPLSDSHVSLFDPHKSLKKKSILIGEPVQKLEKKEKKSQDLKDSEKRLVFQGLAVSPNKTMLCVAKTVGMYHDHLQIRKPSQITFYSLIPVEEDTWSFVHNIYKENDMSLRAITDVLVPFRYALRGKFTEEQYSSLLEWAIPLEEKPTEVLQLLFWALKLHPKCDPMEWELASAEKLFNESAYKKLNAIETLHKYRVDVVVDKILVRRCKQLIKAVLLNEKKFSSIFSLEIEENKQSLEAMYMFLQSKSGGLDPDIPTKPSFDPLPLIPTCYWCKGPLEFPSETIKYDKTFDDAAEFKTNFDSEKLTGFKWNSRRHPVKESGIHRPEICILSLLPLGFPYRRCTNCSVACRFTLPFGQQPHCPLCNAMMYPSQPALKMSDPKEEIEIIHPINIGSRSSRKPPQEGSTNSTEVRVKMESEGSLGINYDDPEEAAATMDVDGSVTQSQGDSSTSNSNLISCIVDYQHLDMELNIQNWTADVAEVELGHLQDSEVDEGDKEESDDEERLAISSSSDDD